MNVLVINGPNLNLLGKRETELYGKTSLSEIEDSLREEARNFKCDLSFFQSNAEHAIIDTIHAANNVMSGIIINAGAFSHTSIAIADALKGIDIKYAVVHITNILKREDFRKVDYLKQGSSVYVNGEGPQGYLIALKALSQII